MSFSKRGQTIAVVSYETVRDPQRCAAAVYRHVVWHGAPQILGLNLFPETEVDPSLFESEYNELDLLAHAWAKLSSDAEPLRQCERSEESHFRGLPHRRPRLFDRGAVKQVWGERVTSVFPRQGHYAWDPQILAGCQPADIQLDHLRDLTHYALSAFQGVSSDSLSSYEQPKIGRPDMAKKSFVTSAQNVVQDQAGKIVDMAKARYEGAKLLVGDAVTDAAKTAKTLIGRPKRKAAGKSKSPAKKTAALKKAVTKKSPKNADKKSSTKAARKKSTFEKSAKRIGA